MTTSLRCGNRERNANQSTDLVKIALTGATSIGIMTMVPSDAEGLRFAGTLGVAIFVSSFVVVNLITRLSEKLHGMLVKVLIVGFVAVAISGWIYFETYNSIVFRYGDGRHYIAGTRFTDTIDPIIKEKGLQDMRPGELVLEFAASRDNRFADIWPVRSVERAGKWLVIKYLLFVLSLGIVLGAGNGLLPRR